MRLSRNVSVTPVLVGVLAALLAGCGTNTTSTNEPSPATSNPSGVSSSAAPPETPPGTPAAGTPAADAVVVAVQVRDGRVQPGLQTTKVKAGQSVTITATSDVADSLHVHGYDKTLDLSPGRAASVSFVADVKGVFEVETHETELLVAKLSVA